MFLPPAFCPIIFGSSYTNEISLHTQIKTDIFLYRNRTNAVLLVTIT